MKLNFKMKKIILILIAIVGLGISANAQKLTIESVTPQVINGKYIITVKIVGEFDQTPSESQKSYSIKVCPKARTPLSDLFVNCEYGTITHKYQNNNLQRRAETFIRFECTVPQNEQAPRCGAHDFVVTKQ